MSKRDSQQNHAQTPQEYKQILQSCIKQLEEVNATILNLQPRLKTNMSSLKYNHDEIVAHSCTLNIRRVFNDLSDMNLAVIRKEATNA